MEPKKIFEPKTVAIVGVSLSNPFHPANVIYNKNHLRYEAEAFCVNPKGGTLYRQKVYSSIREIPSQVELAELIVSFSKMAFEFREEVESIDLNPVLCNRERAVIADARFVLKN